MKQLSFILFCTLMTASALAQPKGFKANTCADIAATSILVQQIIIDPPPAVNYNYYSIWCSAENVGNGTLYPDASNFSAFLYMKTGSGWKLLKKYPLPKMAPGHTQAFHYQLKLRKPKKLPALVLRILPARRGAKNPDCNMRNNVKYRYPTLRPPGINRYQSRK